MLYVVPVVRPLTTKENVVGLSASDRTVVGLQFVAAHHRTRYPISGDPPSVTGAAHVTVAVAEVPVAFVDTAIFVGESGVVDGVAVITEGVPTPMLLIALTRN
jgi:hypothetical protein